MKDVPHCGRYVMHVGNTVIPKPGCSPLRSGCERYSYAVVASLDPFILVSPDGSMLWATTYDATSVELRGQATERESRRAQRRMHREYEAGRYQPNCALIRNYFRSRGLAAPCMSYEGPNCWVLHILPGQDLAPSEAGERLVAVAKECGLYVEPGEDMEAAGLDPLSVRINPGAFCPPAPEALAPVHRAGASGVGAMVRLTEDWLAKGSVSEQLRFRGRLGVVSGIQANGVPDVTFAAMEGLKEERLQVSWKRLEVVLQP